MFYKTGALKTFAKFSGNLQADSCNFIKEKTLAQAFSCEFCEISKNSNFIENLRTTAAEVIVTGDYKNDSKFYHKNKLFACVSNSYCQSKTSFINIISKTVKIGCHGNHMQKL